MLNFLRVLGVSVVQFRSLNPHSPSSNPPKSSLYFFKKRYIPPPKSKKSGHNIR